MTAWVLAVVGAGALGWAAGAWARDRVWLLRRQTGLPRGPLMALLLRSGAGPWLTRLEEALARAGHPFGLRTAADGLVAIGLWMAGVILAAGLLAAIAPPWVPRPVIALLAAVVGAVWPPNLLEDRRLAREQRMYAEVADLMDLIHAHLSVGYDVLRALRAAEQIMAPGELRDAVRGLNAEISMHRGSAMYDEMFRRFGLRIGSPETGEELASLMRMAQAGWPIEAMIDASAARRRQEREVEEERVSGRLVALSYFPEAVVAAVTVILLVVPLLIWISQRITLIAPAS